MLELLAVKVSVNDCLPKVLINNWTYLFESNVNADPHPEKLMAGGLAEAVVGNGVLAKAAPDQDNAPSPKEGKIGEGTAEE